MLGLIKKYEIWILRLAVSFPMMWAGIGGLREPFSWVGFVPEFVEFFIAREAFLLVHSYLMIGLAILLLTGPYRWFIALVSMMNIGGILAFFGFDNVTFRDMSILLVALVLIYRERHLSSAG